MVGGIDTLRDDSPAGPDFGKFRVDTVQLVDEGVILVHRRIGLGRVHHVGNGVGIPVSRRNPPALVRLLLLLREVPLHIPRATKFGTHLVVWVRIWRIVSTGHRHLLGRETRLCRWHGTWTHSRNNETGLLLRLVVISLRTHKYLFYSLYPSPRTVPYPEKNYLFVSKQERRHACRLFVNL